MEAEKIFDGIGKFGVGVVTGFGTALAKGGVDDAYKQEVQDHPTEDVPTHIGHAVGRFFRVIVSSSINGSGSSN